MVEIPSGAELSGAQGSRARIAAAARELFATQGYERATVDAIAEHAGVGRRTFFRYFRSKDEVILPDHDRVFAAIEAHLSAADDLPPVRALCSGARLVFRSYVDDPEVSLQRYRLTRSVPALRARETASVNEYFRLFRRFLFGRFCVEPSGSPQQAGSPEQAGTPPQGGSPEQAGTPPQDGPPERAGAPQGGSREQAGSPGQSGPQGQQPDASLRADVIAGAVVAAHNQVLREWLRGGCQGDPMPSLDAAFGWVVETFEAPASGEVAATGSGPEAGPTAGPSGEDVVVVVFRTGESIDDVMQRISRQL